MAHADRGQRLPQLVVQHLRQAFHQHPLLFHQFSGQFGELGARMLQLRLGLQACGDIVQADQQPLPLRQLHMADETLEVNLVAIGVQALDPPQTHHANITVRLGKTLLRFIMACAQALGNQQFDPPTLHTGAAAPEDALGSGVEQGNAPVNICTDDGVGNQFEDSVKQALLLPMG